MSGSWPDGWIIFSLVIAFIGLAFAITAFVLAISQPAPIQGPTGPTGPMGIRGHTGLKGNVGSIGPTGYVGPTGAQGQVGATGAQGQIGPTGAQGQIGPTGARGEIGPTGAQGEIGPTGPSGINNQQPMPQLVNIIENNGANTPNMSEYVKGDVDKVIKYVNGVPVVVGYVWHQGMSGMSGTGGTTINTMAIGDDNNFDFSNLNPALEFDTDGKFVDTADSHIIDVYPNARLQVTSQKRSPRNCIGLLINRGFRVGDSFIVSSELPFYIQGVEGVIYSETYSLNPQTRANCPDYRAGPHTYYYPQDYLYTFIVTQNVHYDDQRDVYKFVYNKVRLNPYIWTPINNKYVTSNIFPICTTNGQHYLCYNDDQITFCDTSSNNIINIYISFLTMMSGDQFVINPLNRSGEVHMKSIPSNYKIIDKSNKDKSGSELKLRIYPDIMYTVTLLSIEHPNELNSFGTYYITITTSKTMV